MNYRSIDLAFSADWFDDNDQNIWRYPPNKIKEWLNLHGLNSYLYRGVKDEGFVLTVSHIPRPFTSFALLTAPGIKLLNETEYAPIHPDALLLFEFGDLE